MSPLEQKRLDTWEDIGDYVIYTKCMIIDELTGLHGHAVGNRQGAFSVWSHVEIIAYLLEDYSSRSRQHCPFIWNHLDLYEYVESQVVDQPVSIR